MKMNILSSRESYAALITTLPAVKLMEANVAWRCSRVIVSCRTKGQRM